MAPTGSLCGTLRVGLAVANAKTDRAAKGPHRSFPSSEAIPPPPPDGVDDPDPQFYENYVCGAERNYTGYCNPEIDKLVDRQSIESDQSRRRQLVWGIERKLAEDDARPALFYTRAATCWRPQMKGLTLMVNSVYNGSRFEDLWLDN